MSTNLTLPGGLARTRHLALSISLSLLLAACNSDSGDSASTPSATELPFSVEVQGPAANNALGTAVAFSANVADPSNKLKYQWQFGDGETSTQSNPTHRYAQAGLYRVQLLVTNEAGATRVTTADVSVTDGSITSSRQCSGDNSSGWCWQKPLPQGNALNDFVFIDNMRGWAVGQLGTILSTADGGLSWQQQRSGSELPLGKVLFTSAQDGWAVGGEGVILKTRNGGTSWDTAGFLQSTNIASFGAGDANTAWIQRDSSDGVMLTRDGGMTWTKMAVPGQPFVRRYQVVNASIVWAAVDDAQKATLHLTTDSGANWVTVNLPALESGLSRSLYDIRATDSQHVWVMGTENGNQNSAFVSRPLALKSSDGGKTWQNFNFPTEGAQFLQFVTASVGFAVPNYSNTLLRTADGGMTWQRFPFPSTVSGWVNQLKAQSDKLLLIRDAEGQAYRSVDGGSSWQAANAGGGQAPDLTSVWFFNSREGMATATDGSMARTNDGGQTWVTTAPQSQASGWGHLQFLTNGTGWVQSQNGNIYRTTDKGKTWTSPVDQSSASMSGVSDYHFIDEQNGWAVKYSPTSFGNAAPAAIFRSTDGGISWSPIAGTGEIYWLSSVRFADAQNGIAVGGQHVVYVTSDGGTTWRPRATGAANSLRQVTFIDATTAIAVGDYGTVMRSTDRGLTWKNIAAVTNSYLYGVRFVSAKVGWAVGSGGNVIHTRDGGLTWSAQPSGAGMSFNSAFFVNEQTGWIVGANGAIMATSTGGR